MTDPDLAPQLDELEQLLDTVAKVIDTFEKRSTATREGIERLEIALPKLDTMLALAEIAGAPDQSSYAALATTLFAPLSARLQEADAVLDVSFDPGSALDGLTESVKEALGDMTEFVEEAADEFDTSMDGLDTLMSEAVVQDVEETLAEWQSMSEEAEETVTSASEAFEEARSISTDQLQTEIKERLEDAMGEHVTRIAREIEGVFDTAEEVLEKANALVGEGVGNVTDVANRVLVIQKAIKDLRPVLEVLL
ncbi:MAG: hypothetical protein R3F50_18335 [Gammaproteobacteria bacterium]